MCWPLAQPDVCGRLGRDERSLCRPLARALKIKNHPAEIFLLVGFGALWGFLFGVFMNLWSWPFIAGPEQLYWSPGTGPAEALKRYLAYYLITSLVWDLMAALGNVLLILAFGSPVLRLRRFQLSLPFMSPGDPAHPSLPSHSLPLHTWAGDLVGAAADRLSTTRNPYTCSLPFCILVTYYALANRQSGLEAH
jgi:hypothetical protein